MTKKLLLSAAILLAVTACSDSSAEVYDSPAGQCLTAAGWYPTSEGSLTFMHDGVDDGITLMVDHDGIVQPVTESDLDLYVKAGCR